MLLHMDSYNRNLIVNIKGDIDHHNAEELRLQIEREYSKTNSRNIVFNFSEVSFMDSSGIGMIIGRYKNVRKQGGNVSACCINDDVYRIFELSGLHKIIKLYDTIENAVSNQFI